MVMKRNAMRKNLRQSILNSFGRYVAIVSIIALGAALFSGLLMTKTDMVATGQDFVDKQNMFDIRLVNSYGWAQQQLDRAEKLEGIADAEGVIYQDYIVTRQDESKVYRFYTIPEAINRLVLLEGRMPEQPDECLADGFRNDGKILGSRVFISEENAQDGHDNDIQGRDESGLAAGSGLQALLLQEASHRQSHTAAGAAHRQVLP